MVRTEKRVVKIKPLGIQEDVTIISTSKDMVNTARELLKKLEAAEEKETNFSRITESPEALAEFIAEDRKECHSAICMEGLCDGCTKEGVLKWLKQEKKQ